MSNFEELCKKLEEMDPIAFNQNFNQLSVSVLDDLSLINADGVDAYTDYLSFVLAAIAADGKLSEKEFVVIKPLFDKSAGEDVSYEKAVQMFKDMGLDNPENVKNAADLMVDVIELVSPETKDKIVMLCLMICAIDGKVTDDEKKWIAQLIEPLEPPSPMEIIDGYLDEAGSFVLATECGDQPKMRVLGFKTVLDGKIYFGIGTFKDVYAQIQKNPKCEILAFNGEDFVRWDGKAVFCDDKRLSMAFGSALPEIAKMYLENNLEIAFFTLEGGCAEIVGVAGKTVLF
jgi:uncharacterized pyridoxamine 5'-phosphate oxidase family protein